VEELAAHAKRLRTARDVLLEYAHSPAMQHPEVQAALDRFNNKFPMPKKQQTQAKEADSKTEDSTGSSGGMLGCLARLWRTLMGDGPAVEQQVEPRVSATCGATLLLTLRSLAHWPIRLLFFIIVVVFFLCLPVCALSAERAPLLRSSSPSAAVAAPPASGVQEDPPTGANDLRQRHAQQARET